MDLLCLDSRKLGERGAPIARAWKCQNWPMEVSKDQRLKAKRKCYSDREADAWSKFEEITHQWFSYQSWPTCPAKDKHGVR